MDVRARQNLEKRLEDETLTEEKKEEIIEATMKKEAERQMRAKNDKKVEAYVDHVQFGN